MAGLFFHSNKTLPNPILRQLPHIEYNWLSTWRVAHLPCQAFHLFVSVFTKGRSHAVFTWVSLDSWFHVILFSLRHNHNNYDENKKDPMIKIPALEEQCSFFGNPFASCVRLSFCLSCFKFGHNFVFMKLSMNSKVLDASPSGYLFGRKTKKEMEV